MHVLLILMGGLSFPKQKWKSGLGEGTGGGVGGGNKTWGAGKDWPERREGKLFLRCKINKKIN